MRRASVLPILSVVLAAACGDAASDAAYEGEPLVTLPCAVEVAVPDELALQLDLATALVWLDDNGRVLATQPTPGLGLTESFPGAVEVRVLTPPPAAAEVARTGVVGRVALGQVVVFDDSDGDGVLDDGEPPLGASAGLVLAYTSAGASGEALGTLAPGFHRLAPSACPSTPRLAADATCAVEVGKQVADLFPLVCPDDFVCVDLPRIRNACRFRPDWPLCTECPGAVFPAGATPAECDAWLPGCVAAYPPAECQTEHAICVAGEPPCDMPCLCQNELDYCVEVADAATCRGKFEWCLGP